MDRCMRKPENDVSISILNISGNFSSAYTILVMLVMALIKLFYDLLNIVNLTFLGGEKLRFAAITVHILARHESHFSSIWCDGNDLRSIFWDYGHGTNMVTSGSGSDGLRLPWVLTLRRP